ncbi:hypothetical protein AU476_05140 [Cupriavidus sp. UYMSc13B]|nr:hypothetical protein AU476_05140 [Cupriavidus sp. UYMSc13B]
MIRSGDDEKTARLQALEIVEAMPVGADLSTIAAEVLYDLLYTSPWEITQHFSSDVGSDLIRQIKVLHQREHVGECVASTEWEALQRKAVLLSGYGLDPRQSVPIEELAVSLSDANAVHCLPRIVEYAGRNYRRLVE